MRNFQIKTYKTYLIIPGGYFQRIRESYSGRNLGETCEENPVGISENNFEEILSCHVRISAEHFKILLNGIPKKGKISTSSKCDVIYGNSPFRNNSRNFFWKVAQESIQECQMPLTVPSIFWRFFL